MNEIWKPVIGHPIYEVSSLGRVRSIPRKVRCMGGFRMNNGKLLKAYVCSGTGYMQVTLEDRKKHSVHRLVAIAHLPLDASRPMVNHKNGVRNDNRLENLEWVTNSENLVHGFRVLKRRNSYKGKFGADHSTSKSVIATSIKTGEQIKFDAAIEAVRKLGCDSGSISRACRGMISQHKGYFWNFCDE